MDLEQKQNNSDESGIHTYADAKKETADTTVSLKSDAKSDQQSNATEHQCSDETAAVEKLSKKQQRKLKKEQNWLKYKPIKRAQEKEKKKQRRRDAVERGEELPPSRKKLKLNTMAKSVCKVSVAIDCSFDSYMMEKDIIKLAKQIQFCYSANRRATNPLQFHVCGIGGQIKGRLDGVGDYKNWDVFSTEKEYLEVFDKEKLVYLSSDSPNILHDLDPNSIYVIGGLVDHNHHKGLCHQLAEERGVAHAQLPISDYIDLKSRKVLTINHVFEILLCYTETKDWQKAFFSVLPSRKGVQAKVTTDSEEIKRELNQTDLSETGSYGTGKQCSDLNETDYTSVEVHSDNPQCSKQNCDDQVTQISKHHSEDLEQTSEDQCGTNWCSDNQHNDLNCRVQKAIVDLDS